MSVAQVWAMRRDAAVTPPERRRAPLSRRGFIGAAGSTGTAGALAGGGLTSTAAIQTGRPAPGHIQAVVNALRPAYRAAIGQPGDLEDNMIRAQTRLTVRRLQKDPLLRRLIVTDGLRIVGGHYNLDTGIVQVIA
jgi:hypothetical protein